MHTNVYTVPMPTLSVDDRRAMMEALDRSCRIDERREELEHGLRVALAYNDRAAANRIQAELATLGRY